MVAAREGSRGRGPARCPPPAMPCTLPPKASQGFQLAPVSTSEPSDGQPCLLSPQLPRNGKRKQSNATATAHPPPPAVSQGRALPPTLRDRTSQSLPSLTGAALPSHPSRSPVPHTVPRGTQGLSVLPTLPSPGRAWHCGSGQTEAGPWGAVARAREMQGRHRGRGCGGPRGWGSASWGVQQLSCPANPCQPLHTHTQAHTHMHTNPPGQSRPGGHRVHSAQPLRGGRRIRAGPGTHSNPEPKQPHSSGEAGAGRGRRDRDRDRQGRGRGDTG